MVEVSPSGQGDGLLYGGLGTLCESVVAGCRLTDGWLEGNELSKARPCKSFVVVGNSLGNRVSFLWRRMRLAKVSWNLDAAIWIVR
jgi:hypothetical protein